jgi:hypothetical protein
MKYELKHKSLHVCCISFPDRQQISLDKHGQLTPSLIQYMFIAWGPIVCWEQWGIQNWVDSHLEGEREQMGIIGITAGGGQMPPIVRCNSCTLSHLHPMLPLCKLGHRGLVGHFLLETLLFWLLLHYPAYPLSHTVSWSQNRQPALWIESW